MVAQNSQSEAWTHKTGSWQSSEQTPALATAEWISVDGWCLVLDHVSALHACLEHGAEPHTWKDTAFIVPVIKFIGKEVPREIHRDRGARKGAMQ